MTSGKPPREWDRLLSAAQKNNAELVNNLIIDHGVNPSHANAVGQSALHIAALWGNVEAVKALITHGASVDAKNSITGATPLHCAVQSNKEPAANRVTSAKLLLTAGADPSIPDKFGAPPIEYAIDEDDMRTTLLDGMPTQELFSHIADTNVDGMRGCLEVDGQNVNMQNQDGNTPLLFAIETLIQSNDCKKNVNEIVEMLIENESVDLNLVNKEGQSPIHYICTAMRQQYSGPETNESKENIEYLKALTSLLMSKESVILPQDTILLLHDASRRGNIEMILFLLNDVGIDVNSKGRQGLSPLHFAARSGRAEAAELLLKCGANANTLDSMGKTPLDAATINEKDDVIELLKNTKLS
mmetsp:Transcript_12444/g.15581  ORF Transcript_12444/g.15581 Transcript_12444/m.15581 type:complete len:357 (+) Transcript_12444:68-1138(+)|eukprot:CAMPEP_0172496938 /NCGR_PEP_ID=MMETSP1066-20121228/94701_1 /TAXON_ID=671091 /ORGANISM="Coscinodiscus wailesii, Strain CCMP2513" /LENGTH=356 /DNA_ID=CAMNT_0013269495 /DNA_START=44 /DNA_END=1114 /DNA_ORIENTATION=-